MQTRANHDAEVFSCNPCARTLPQMLHRELDIQYSLKIPKSQELVKFDRMCFTLSFNRILYTNNISGDVTSECWSAELDWCHQQPNQCWDPPCTSAVCQDKFHMWQCSPPGMQCRHRSLQLHLLVLQEWNQCPAWADSVGGLSITRHSTHVSAHVWPSAVEQSLETDCTTCRRLLLSLYPLSVWSPANSARGVSVSAPHIEPKTRLKCLISQPKAKEGPHLGNLTSSGILLHNLSGPTPASRRFWLGPWPDAFRLDPWQKSVLFKSLLQNRSLSCPGVNKHSQNDPSIPKPFWKCGIIASSHAFLATSRAKLPPALSSVFEHSNPFKFCL